MISKLMLSPHHRVFGLFSIYAFSANNIYLRLPELQNHFNIDDATLGLCLLGAPVGTIFALTFGARPLQSINIRLAIMIFTPFLAASFAASILSSNPILFALLLIPVGILIGSLELLLNLEADRVEYAMGRKIMNRAHAFWSFGFFGAGIFGSLMGYYKISPQLHLGLVIPICLLINTVLLWNFKPAAHRPSTDTSKPPLFAFPNKRIFILIGITASAMLLEGVNQTWATIYMNDVFGAAPLLTGAAIVCFSLSQAMTRYFVDGLVDRTSSQFVGKTLIFMLFIGTMMIAVSPSSFLSLIGFTLSGIGVSAIFPLAISAAAQHHDRPAAINVASLAQVSLLIFLIGPPLLGNVGQSMGIRWVFGVTIPLIILGYFLSSALGGSSKAQEKTSAN
jgi:predicted MFS family arabinose efflux permease